MPLDFNEESNGKLLAIPLNGRLGMAESLVFAPAAGGMSDFPLREASVAWQDLKLGVHHLANIMRHVCGPARKPGRMHRELLEP